MTLEKNSSGGKMDGRATTPGQELETMSSSHNVIPKVIPKVIIKVIPKVIIMMLGPYAALYGGLILGEIVMLQLNGLYSL